ncbi:hypothetical protein GCM10023258_21630 [Terrabacter aeriphilus]|uniref:Aminoglycoside phosphotransferase domain-containing protein n=1 Tax=Terrabacter aeriphilus TaxID=515662 RepID=A0ABP9JDD5_9MICO
MTRSPLVLAALASSAVPGLDPVNVEGVVTRPGDLFEIAYVQDSQHRRWVVKAPRTPAAGAMLDDSVALGALLGRRLDVAMPMVRGHAPVPEGRAAVYLRLPGRPLDFAGLTPGALADDVGRALAHIHNVEHLVFEEAGRPTYDAESHRRRQLSELDRAAATGHVPTGLLTRWEHALEDVSMWRFAPTAVHGTFTGENVLASFDDDDDSSTGRVRGVLGWEESRVGDPADDVAELAEVAAPAALDAVLEAYARSRVERPDASLVRRARLAAEMTPLRVLLRALAAGQIEVVERTAEQLRALDARVEDDDRRRAAEDARRSERTRLAQERAAAAASSAAVVPPATAPGTGAGSPPGSGPGAGSAPGADDAHREPEPAWDATAPHVPFPMLGETQAVPMVDELGEPDPSTTTTAPGSDDDVTAADPSDGPTTTPEPTETFETPETPETHAAPAEPADPAARAAEPEGSEEPAAEESQPVPVVAADADDSAFEIDEVEALPEEADGVLDLHEGASDFVPVTPAEHPKDR